jgi:predicted transcriptional regulator
MNVLLSINPKFVEAIVDGTKRYEFRRTIFRRRDVEKAFIYCTSPVQRVIGAFQIGRILEDTPSRLWADLKSLSGLSKRDYLEYFHGSQKAYAIEIRDFYAYDEPLDPRELDPGFVPPQSFAYLEHDFETS